MTYTGVSLSTVFATREVAERFGVHPQTIRRWEREGVIPAAIRRRNQRVFTTDDLRRIAATVIKVPESAAGEAPS